MIENSAQAKDNEIEELKQKLISQESINEKLETRNDQLLQEIDKLAKYKAFYNKLVKNAVDEFLCESSSANRNVK